MNLAVAETYVLLIEAAELLGLSKQRLSQLYAAGKLPDPDAWVSGRPAWKPETLKDWDRERHRN